MFIAGAIFGAILVMAIFTIESRRANKFREKIEESRDQSHKWILNHSRQEADKYFGWVLGDANDVDKEMAAEIKRMKDEITLLRRYSACHPLLGLFVTAKLRHADECRQGWVIWVNEEGLILKGETGTEYQCEMEAEVVVNPPEVPVSSKPEPPEPPPPRRVRTDGTGPIPPKPEKDGGMV